MNANRPKSAVEAAQALLEQAGEAEDPWLLSYADLVTNLLAFMVVLVSMAGISFETIDALPQLFDREQSPRPIATLTADIQELVEEEGLTGKVKTTVDPQGLAIMLEDRILFPSGVADLSPSGSGLVEKLAGALSRLPDRYKVAVEGHTDDVPISTPRFRSNWALSASRGLEVRRALSAAGVEDRRLSVVAYADTRPAPAPADLPLEEVRRRNRRVVIRVYF